MGKDGKNEILGVEEDDPREIDNDVDVDIDIDGENDDEDMDLEELLKRVDDDIDDEYGDEDDDKDDDEDDDKDDDKDDEEPEGKPEVDVDAIVNQRVSEELNRIIPERLKRDRKTQEVAEIEQLTGMSLAQIREQIVNNSILEKADRLGISEEEAREIVMKEHEAAGLKAEKTQKEQEEIEMGAAMRQVNYLRDKTKFVSHPKYAHIIKEIEAEVDAFTQNGTILSFEDGAQYILGQKLLKGGLFEKMKTGAENKAKADIAKRGKAVPQSKPGGAKTGTSLSKEQKLIAAALGVTEKEYAAEMDTGKKRKR